MQTVQPQSGTIFVSGGDAPLPSVVSFRVVISGISVAEGMGTPVTVTTGPQTVDFAKLNGLHTLLDLNTIPAGSYDTVIVTLASPEIDYLNVTNPQTNPRHGRRSVAYTVTTTPPVMLSTSTVTISLSSPLVVNAGDVIGLGFEFDIRKSLAVDMSGQITGVVNPTLHVKAITPSDADAYIDEFIAGVTTVNATGNSFTIQGPHGRAFAVNVNDQTEWEGSETINNLTNASIVSISGTLDRTAGTFPCGDGGNTLAKQILCRGPDHLRGSASESRAGFRSVRAKRAAGGNGVQSGKDLNDRPDREREVFHLLDAQSIREPEI